MILGERVRLRAIERDDLPRYVEWFNDPEVRQYLNLFLPMSLPEEERWFEQMLDRDPVERPLAIDVKPKDKWVHVGGCGLFNVDARAHSAEFGISIGDKTYWDQGYGTEAVRSLLRHAFETLNLRRISLNVFEYNERAISVYQRVGFKEEGRLRQAKFHQGRYWDTLVMGILRHEWEQSKEVAS
ncbi:MAG: GNAT family protein [Anaerolineales bacterium]|jgi:RimJ/RimL family protein N-acetyltransferase